jgi:hypothetical protein
MEEMYNAEKKIPKFFWDILTKQRSGLIEMRKKFGKEQISASELAQI